MKATASAPGKILWLGGYSVLEKGKTAYVSSVGPRCYATAETLEKEPVKISAPQLGATAEYWAKGGKLTPASNTPEEMAKATKFVAAGAEAALAYCIAKGHKASPGMAITTRSDPAFASGAGKSGLGASAAVTVATVAAVLGAHGVQASEKAIHNISQYAHAIAQGKVGSGFDVAAAAFGSCVYSRYSPDFVEKATPLDFDREWDYAVEKLELPKALAPAFANISGTSASTTDMVKKVRAWKEANDGDYRSLIAELDSANKHAIGAIKKIADNQPAFDELRQHFTQSRKITARLGELSGAAIEPPELARALDESEENGALCAKLPGAGGGDAIAALCLGGENKQKLQAFWKGYSQVRLEAIEVDGSLGGVRLQKAEL